MRLTGASRSRGESQIPSSAHGSGTSGRLELVLVAVVVVPALVFGAAAYYDRTQLIQAAEKDARSGAAFSREHARKAIETQQLLIRELDRRVQAMTWDQIRASSASLATEIQTMHAGLPQVSAVGLIDPDGRLVTGSMLPEARDFLSNSHRAAWSAGEDTDSGTYISGPYVSAQTGRLNFDMVRRRTSPIGTLDGAMYVAVAASYFSDFWAETAQGSSGVTVSLVRTDGVVLARFPLTSSRLPRPLPQGGPWMRHLATNPNGGLFVGTSPVDGVERIFAYGRVGDYPLVIGYGISLQSVQGVWYRHLLVFGSVCALAVAALVMAVLSAIRQMRRRQMEQARRLTAEAGALEGQRLELLGHLAAGVAHDFRNIVHAIENGADLIENAADQPQRVQSLARVIREAAQRGKALTQGMLDLARRQRGDADDTAADTNTTTRPAEAVLNVETLLSRTLGSAYTLRCELDPVAVPLTVAGSRGELEAALVNLAVNARDAMPNGGEVVITCRMERVADDLVVAPKSDQGHEAVRVAPGLYVHVSVADTGVGMAPEVLARAGEPFFTTKPRGRGTGLGLAGARGFTERANGTLLIDSVVGRGTTVNLWLPVVAATEGC